MGAGTAIGLVWQSFSISQSDGWNGGLLTVGGGSFVGVGGSYASNSVTNFHGGTGNYWLGAGNLIFIALAQYRTQVAQCQVSKEAFSGRRHVDGG